MRTAPDFGAELSRRRIALFLAVSFAFSWAYVLLYDARLADRFVDTTAGRITPHLAAWGPLVGVAVVLWRSECDVRGWFARQLTLSEPLGLYVVAFLLPNAVSSAAMVVYPARGIALDVSMSPVNFALVFGFTFVLLGALEEFGWRGYLQPALQARTNATTAAVIVGAVWALWHLPSYFLGYLGNRPLWLFALHLVPMSIVLAWLVRNAVGILPAMTFHAAHNAPGNVFAVAGEGSMAVATEYYLVYTGIWLAVGGAVVAWYGPSLVGDRTDATSRRPDGPSGY